MGSRGNPSPLPEYPMDHRVVQSCTPAIDLRLALMRPDELIGQTSWYLEVSNSLQWTLMPDRTFID